MVIRYVADGLDAWFRMSEQESQERDPASIISDFRLPFHVGRGGYIRCGRFFEMQERRLPHRRRRSLSRPEMVKPSRRTSRSRPKVRWSASGWASATSMACTASTHRKAANPVSHTTA